MNRLTLALIGAYSLLLGGAAPAASTPAQSLESAISGFLRKGASGTLEERKEALRELVAYEDAKAVPPIAQEFSRASIKLRKARDEAYRLEYHIERKRELVDRLKLREERDPSLKSSLATQREKLSKLQSDLEKEKSTISSHAPWLEFLSTETRAFLERIGASKRKAAEKGFWKSLDEETGAEERLAAVEMLGYLGGDGTAIAMQKLIGDLLKERAKLEKRLPKLMAEVRDFERRLQEDSERNGGGVTRGMDVQYERVKEEATAAQTSILLLGYVADAAATAGGRSLARESEAALAKSMQKLAKGLKKAKDGTRRRTIRLLGGADSPTVTAALFARLQQESEPGAKADLIDALAGCEGDDWVGYCLETLLKDESWHVKARAASALAKARVREAIPALIDGMDREEGRTVTDFQEALTDLTGKNFRANVTLWRRWWAEVKDDFVVPEVAELEEQASEDAKDSVGVTFFGIRTDSKRVLFVLDLSGSMNFAMVPRGNPDDEPGRPFDEPRDGEISRLTEAKRSLTKAIGGIEDGATFNVIFYASDVWTWQDRLVDMNGDTRSDALRFVEELEAVGGTNIYGALEQALEMAGAEGGDEWVAPKIDTIFFVSDGRPSVGLTTDADDIIAYVREKNENAGIVIHTIGISGAQDAHLLGRLAEENGGTYVAR